MIAVVDSGVANLRSVSNALNHLGAEHHIAHTPADLHGADKVILPGVGAFSAGMAQLRSRGFRRQGIRNSKATIQLGEGHVGFREINLFETLFELAKGWVGTDKFA